MSFFWSVLLQAFLELSVSHARVCLLVNGGASPTSNHPAFYTDIEAIKKSLGPKCSRIEIFTASGSSAARDLNTGKRDGDQFYVLSRPPFAGKPATALELQKAIAAVPKNEDLLVYFTDHGDRETVDLWQEELRPAQLLSWIDQRSANTLLIHDHCFSSGMLEKYQAHGSSKICAVASAQREEWGYNDFSAAILPQLDGEHRLGKAVRGYIQDKKNWKNLLSFKSVVTKLTGSESMPSLSTIQFAKSYLAEHRASTIMEPLAACSKEPAWKQGMAMGMLALQQSSSGLLDFAAKRKKELLEAMQKSDPEFKREHVIAAEDYPKGRLDYLAAAEEHFQKYQELGTVLGQLKRDYLSEQYPEDWKHLQSSLATSEQRLEAKRKLHSLSVHNSDFCRYAQDVCRQYVLHEQALEELITRHRNTTRIGLLFAEWKALSTMEAKRDLAALAHYRALEACENLAF